MAVEQLSDVDRRIIGECLRAAAEGPFFKDEGAKDPYWEFHSLFGLDREGFARIAAAYPNVDSRNESVALAINNTLGNLLGYPHGHDKDWSSYISAPAAEVAAVFKRWRESEGEGLR